MYLPLFALPAADYPAGISSLVPIAVSFMVVFVALLYMCAQFFKKPEWEQMAGSELYQLFVSLIIFICIFSLYTGVNAVVHEFSGGSSNDIFDVAQKYLEKVSYEYMVPNLLKLEVFKLYMQHLSGLFFRLGPQAWSMQWPVFPGLETVEKSIDFTLTMMTPVTASLMAQQIGIQFLRAFCPLLVAAGVLLRIFAPTRDAGSFMIVSGFAFSFVFPFTYYIHSVVVDYMWSEQTQVSDHVEGFGQLQGESGIAINTMWTVIGGDTSLLQPIRLLSFAMLQALFLPALSMVVTVTFIKSTLKFVSQKLD